jgi:ATP adenylyltransferase
MLSKTRLKKVSCMKEFLTEELTSLLKEKENKNISSLYDESTFNTFREKVSFLFACSTSIRKSKIVDEFFYQNGIKFLLKHLKKDEISNKPINLTSGNESKVQDALAPPYEDGQLVEEDFADRGTHRLLFNKFAVMEEHVVLITRDFSSQYTHLTYDDCINALILKRRLDAVIFFNGGKDAGSSQPRKHLQAIPLKSMYYGDFGLFLLLKDAGNLQPVLFEELLKYDVKFVIPFKFFKLNLIDMPQHLIIKFDQENIDELYLAYNIALVYLNLLEDEDKITKNYSVLLFDNYLMIITRVNSRINLSNGHLDINSVGFLFTLLLKSEELSDEVKKINLIDDIYSKL